MSGSARRRRMELAVAAVATLPAAKAVADAFTGALGANPVAEVLHRLGFWTLTLLAATLACTPLVDLAGLAWAARARRALGLSSFTYGLLHLLWYLGVDQGLDVALLGADVVKRPFITLGLAALLLLAPLAVTSTDAWVRRLGFRRWKALHRLVYPAAGLGLIHFWWREKADHRRPLLFVILVAVLLGARLVKPLGRWLRGATAAGS